MRRMLVAAVLATAACGSATALAEPDESTGVIPTIVVQDLNPNQWTLGGAQHPMTIHSATFVSDHSLRMVVGYGGGCRVHAFALVVSDEFVPRLESPGGQAVETEAVVGHDANGDNCERAVRDTLVADLRVVRNAYRSRFDVESGAVVLRFDETEQVRYAF